jgi:hypothetical protein
MGNIITSNGLCACPKKTEAIVNIPTPTSKQELMRFLGMVPYLAQFIPNESTLSAPLRELLKKDVPWYWEHKQNVSFNALKKALVCAPLLQFYDVTKPVLIQTDASQSGLGSCLLQDRHLWPMPHAL